MNWWFVFKFNSQTYPACGGAQRTCAFGGSVQPYTSYGQRFAFASSLDSTLQMGGGCVGDTTSDPLGATFAQVYNGKFYYVLWNDQFYGDPIATTFGPAGHSKGMLAWNENGEGLVLQVTTPSWPASGSSTHPRQTDGNTLGCVLDDDVLVSQDFFALKLSKADVVSVLEGLSNSSVTTDPTQLQIVNNGGPAEIQALVRGLGTISASLTPIKTELSSGVVLLSKPSNLNVPPWQMVSALLGGEPLRVATWWTPPEIPTTTAATPITCWDPSLGAPGAVEIATTGSWLGLSLGFDGVAEPNGNHAKIGVSMMPRSVAGASPRRPEPRCQTPGCQPQRGCASGDCSQGYVIFGDMNQQGSLLTPNCNSSQNGRGGLFFVLQDPGLYRSIQTLLAGQTAAQ